MKFLMFSDFHYYPGVFYGDTVDTIKMFQQRAQEEGCAFILHAGDLCHGPSTVPELIEVCNNSPVPMYHCLGNHDTDQTPYEQTLKLYNMPDGHYYFDCQGYRFIVLDPNYCKVDGEYIHYDLGNYFQWPDLRDYTPPEQLIWLEETIAQTEKACILVSHDSYERAGFTAARESQQVQQIIRQANAKRPNHVLMVMNGHHHRDYLRILDNVLYWDVNATHYDWIGDNQHNAYPEEMQKRWKWLGKTVNYTDPLYAIVTLEGNTITIEGAQSTMLMGVSRRSLGKREYDEAGRILEPRIQSCKITLG